MSGTTTFQLNVTGVFSQLHESLQQVLDQRLKWTEIRTVQENAWGAIASGDDVLVIAPTAGGKSEAALIPVIDDILKHGRCGVCCIYIAPLKALLNDQEERVASFCTPTSLSVLKWHGDVPKSEREWKDGEPPHILMITPESLEVVLREKKLLPGLREVQTVIIDELHAFVESERGVQLKVLLHRLDQLAKRDVQRVGLSATMGNPEEILSWLSEGRHGSQLVAVPSPEKEKRFKFIVEEEESSRIDALARAVSGKKSLVFVNSRSEAERIVQLCNGRIRNLSIHHSSISPALRKSAEAAFTSPDGACIVCTSTLELGIDIGDLDIVVQAGPPDTVSSFLQRMGRTGRRGNAASIVWLLKNPEEFLVSVAIIESAMDRNVEELIPPELPYNVLLQQLFLTLHTKPRITEKQLASAVLSAPVFSGISQPSFHQIVSHLITTRFITFDGEVLMPGEEMEKVVLRSKGREFYSVIAGGAEYRAMTPDGEEIGRLDARFVTKGSGGGVTLGGREWAMVKCDDAHDIVVVVPESSEGLKASRVFWTGGEEPGLSPLICQAIHRICSRGGSILPLLDRELGILSSALRQFPQGLEGNGLFIVKRKTLRGNEAAIFTFMGSRFNGILGRVLLHFLGGRTRIRYNDFAVIVPLTAKEESYQNVVAAIDIIRKSCNDDVSGILPLSTRGEWKFSGNLPENLFREMILSDYYHIHNFFVRFRALGRPIALDR